MLELNTTISPADHMLTASEEAYFRTSRSALSSVQAALASIGKQPDSVRKILDFGCGYGRVLRALRAGFPDAEITACDLMEDAVGFCAATFDAKPLKGHEDPAKIEFPDHYDLIWLGSVFTHLPESKWGALLISLQNVMAPNALLVFTVHGRTAMWVIEKHSLAKSPLQLEDFEEIKRNYKESGYSFFNYSDGHVSSLNRMGISVSEDYGLSFTRPDWVCNYLQKYERLFLANYTEGGWGRNHDVVSLWLPSDPRDV